MTTQARADATNSIRERLKEAQLRKLQVDTEVEPWETVLEALKDKEESK